MHRSASARLPSTRPSRVSKSGHSSRPATTQSPDFPEFQSTSGRRHEVVTGDWRARRWTRGWRSMAPVERPDGVLLRAVISMAPSWCATIISRHTRPGWSRPGAITGMPSTSAVDTRHWGQGPPQATTGRTWSRPWTPSRTPPRRPHVRERKKPSPHQGRSGRASRSRRTTWSGEGSAEPLHSAGLCL